MRMSALVVSLDPQLEALGRLWVVREAAEAYIYIYMCIYIYIYTYTYD